tara:strand:+ start:216 stop:491 length:276 start_codon:yes stop_codon:yes gene_type:complete
MDMSVFNYIKVIITLAIIGSIVRVNYLASTATVEEHGTLDGVLLVTLLQTNILFTVLVVGLSATNWALKRENKKLISKVQNLETPTSDGND